MHEQAVVLENVLAKKGYTSKKNQEKVREMIDLADAPAMPFTLLKLRLTLILKLIVLMSFARHNEKV